MSAPDTNIERQADRHKPALFGIRAAMVFGALMLLGVTFAAFSNGGETTLDELYDGSVEQTGGSVGFDPYVPGTNVSN